MKKLFTLLAALVMATGAFAKDYTDDLVVTVDKAAPTTLPNTTITVTPNVDDTYNFSLKNFKFGTFNLGNIDMKNVPAIKQNGVTYLLDTQNVSIKLGTLPLTVPVTLRAELRDNEAKMYASMDINVVMKPVLNQKVKVLFGGGYQMPNNGFENYHKATVYDYKYDDDSNPIGIDSTAIIAQVDEPNAWHSFQSATGALASLAGATPHIFQSTKHHGGSYSVMLKSSEIFGIVANGTMTTGRMNAASVDAADVTNNAWLDMSKDDKDGNGDPFYTTINGLPDSLVVWVNYNQANVNDNNAVGHPYATVSAAITDGTYYQDPQDKEYTNVLAAAKNNTIAATGDAWKRISIPFEVKDKTIDGKAILITISTNADAGKGSDGDSIYVDDLSFIYNDPTNVKIDWNDAAATRAGSSVISPDNINVTYDGAIGAKVVKSLKQDGDNVVATVTVFNGDLTKQIDQETHTYEGAVTGIKAIDLSDAKTTDAPTEIYSISGQRVSDMQPGQVYIVKKGDKVVKVLKK